MNCIKKILFFVSLPFVFSSCYTFRSFPVEIVRPAEIGLPYEINSLVILNNSLLSIPDSVLNDSSIIIETSAEYLYNIASTGAVKNLADIINEVPARILVLPEHILETLPEDSIYVKPVFTPVELIDITWELNVDGLVSLDYIEISDSLIFWPTPQNIDGVWITHQVAGIQRRVTCLWRFYNLRENELHDEFLMKDTLLFNAPNSTWDMESSKNLILGDPYFLLATYDETGWYAGFGYARRIIPVFKPENRILYSGKPYWLRKSYRLIRTNQWEKAEDLLLTFSRHENPRKAAAAFYNLAFLSEMESDLQLARFYVEMSLKKHHTTIAKEYHQILEQRIDEKPGIDQYLVF